MNIVAICPTFNRAHLIPNVLAMFNAQDYPTNKRRLVIYDDAGQFDEQKGDGWQLISTPTRHATLGEKFDQLVQIAAVAASCCQWSDDETAIALFEDDDVYLQSYLSAHAATLGAGVGWSAPSQILSNDSVGRGKWHARDSLGRHHGAWAYRLSAYRQSGGYPREQTEGFDYALGSRLRAAGIKMIDTLLTGCGPIYLYRWFSVLGSLNGSAFGAEIMVRQGVPTARQSGPIVPQFDPETAGYYRAFGFASQ